MTHGLTSVDVAFPESCSWAASHDFTVADITMGPILGMDFLQKHAMSVNLGQHSLEWMDHSVPLIEERGPLVGRVVLRESVSCSTAEERFVTALVVDQSGEQVSCTSECLFEPDERLIKADGNPGGLCFGGRSAWPDSCSPPCHTDPRTSARERHLVGSVIVSTLLLFILPDHLSPIRLSQLRG